MNNKTSVIITAFKEPKTIKKAIESIILNKIKNIEILVVAPDDETLEEAKKIRNKKLKFLKDKGKGKPEALNLAVSKAKGDILILTDGDVFIGQDSLRKLLRPLDNIKIGAVSGRPISMNKNDNKYGFWAHILTNIADSRRKKALKNKKRIFCSGYLFAIRKKLFPYLDEELLSEDGYISHIVYQRNYLIDYSPESKVFIKYPTNFKDWITQKRRSTGGYNQNYKILGVKIRSFSSESKGFIDFFKYTSNFKQFIWIFELFISRLYLWFLIYKDINFKKKKREEIWLRVESTK
jgi:cellulose synthase/poly-beta-1,6-N-acetylglucosamine synthase-like glycosyltransferase